MHWKKLTALLFVLAIVILYRYLRPPDEQISTDNFKSTSVNEEEYLKLLQENTLEFTKHSICRMDCRKIDKEEILDVLENGHINWKKSDLQDKPCPSIAVEGITRDGQEARVVFASCENTTRVITAIDLKKEWPCDCY